MVNETENKYKFVCNKCNFNCNSKSHWNIHIMTAKHNTRDIAEDLPNENSVNHEPESLKNNINMTTVVEPVENIHYDENTNGQHTCICGKKYKYKQGLSVHKKKCNKSKLDNSDIKYTINENRRVSTDCTSKTSIELEADNLYLKSTIKELMTQNEEFKNILVNDNKEFKSLLIEQTKKVLEMSNSTGNITNNIHNNKFNLNIFLNEECKNAINITDYVDKMDLQLEDLEQTARLGYTDGITKIISDRMRETGINHRPFHCMDGKREIVYVRDNNVWERENSDKSRMRRMITNVIHKNLQQLYRWHEKHPECLDTLHNKSTEYLNIMIEANGGNPEDREKKEERILKNILKEALLK